HVWEEVIAVQRFIATLEVVNLNFALCKRHMWHWVNELARIRQDAVVDLVGPELTCHLELLIDVHRLGDINFAALFRRVVQLAQCGVDGTSVIPRGRRFQSRAVKTLKDHLSPTWLQFPEHCTQGRTHDASTN